MFFCYVIFIHFSLKIFYIFFYFCHFIFRNLEMLVLHLNFIFVSYLPRQYFLIFFFIIYFHFSLFQLTKQFLIVLVYKHSQLIHSFKMI